MAILVVGLAVVCVLYLSLGARPLSPGTLLAALTAYDANSFDHQALYRFRLPRLVAALMVGGALALAGSMLQTLIRNPLAEPQLLGLNAGAALAVVAPAVLGLGIPSATQPLMAALGALVAFSIVLGLSGMGRNGATPLKVTLCGIVVSAFASAITSALLLLDAQAIEDLRLWLAGDLGGQSPERLITVAPFLFISALGALLLSPRLSIMALGDDVARGLGVNLASTRLLTLTVAALLCGSAITLAGPIGFVGLIVPHIVRRFIGNDLRVQFSASLLGGALLVILADLFARQLIAPMEVSTGVVTGAVGAIFFIILATRFFK